MAQLRILTPLNIQGHRRTEKKQTFIHASGWIRTNMPEFKRLQIQGYSK